MADYDERLRQAKTLARLASLPDPVNWVQEQALLAQFQLDLPEDYEQLSAGLWIRLLTKQPQLAEKLQRWSHLHEIDWMWLSAAQPQLAQYRPQTKGAPDG